MKKTIHISLAGASFAAEEDAFERLDVYLKDLRAHFSSYPDSEEILRDIESRFAEHFSSKAGVNQVIQLPEVEGFIGVMGTPDQFETDHKTEQETPKKEEAKTTRKFFRNPDDMIIAGVASGIAAYLGIDTIWPRLIFAISIFFGGFGVILYIILWVLIPEAKTETDKMDMRGEPFNIKNLEQQVKERASEMRAGKTSKNFDGPINAFGGSIRAIGQAIAQVLGMIIKIIGAIVVVASVIGIVSLVFTAATLVLNANSQYVDFPLQSLAHGTLYYIGIASGFFLVLIPLIALVMLGSSVVSNKSKFSKSSSIALICLWVTSGILFANSALTLAPQIKEIFDNNPDFKSETRVLDLKDFNTIKLNGADSATIIPSSTYLVLVEGQKKDLDFTKVSVENQVLKSNAEKPFQFCFFCVHKSLKFTIYTPDIKSIEASGASKVILKNILTQDLKIVLNGASRIEGEVQSESLDADLSGASRLTLTGTTTDAVVKLSGASSFKANQMALTNLKINASGASKAYANQLDSLDVNLSGASHVYYSKTKTLNQDLSGASRLHENWNGESLPIHPIEPISPSEPDFLIE